ncbi:MAG: hypothetical protein C5B50_02035 [Verrucomicrobia bacterium]|nr:MAG: hypothetical protein C5B50_02035 [Verrucomicrobiota bacterium]
MVSLRPARIGQNGRLFYQPNSSEAMGLSVVGLPHALRLDLPLSCHRRAEHGPGEGGALAHHKFSTRRCQQHYHLHQLQGPPLHRAGQHQQLLCRTYELDGRAYTTAAAETRRWNYISAAITNTYHFLRIVELKVPNWPN